MSNATKSDDGFDFDREIFNLTIRSPSRFYFNRNKIAQKIHPHLIASRNLYQACRTPKFEAGKMYIKTMQNENPPLKNIMTMDTAFTPKTRDLITKAKIYSSLLCFRHLFHLGSPKAKVYTLLHRHALRGWGWHISGEGSVTLVLAICLGDGWQGGGKQRFPCSWNHWSSKRQRLWTFQVVVPPCLFVCFFGSLACAFVCLDHHYHCHPPTPQKEKKMKKKKDIWIAPQFLNNSQITMPPSATTTHLFSLLVLHPAVVHSDKSNVAHWIFVRPGKVNTVSSWRKERIEHFFFCFVSACRGECRLISECVHTTCNGWIDEITRIQKF